MNILFDISVLVAIDRGQHRELCTNLSSKHDLAISMIAVAEMYQGAYYSDTESALEKAESLLMQFDWLDFDGPVAETTGKILADLQNTGEPVGFQDTAIAATVQAYNQDYLVSEETSHFERLLPDTKLISMLDAAAL